MRVMDLNGVSAVITGGASGLGEGTARKLASLGVRCTLFDRNEDGAKSVAGDIGANYVAGDVTNPDDCQTAPWTRRPKVAHCASP